MEMISNTLVEGIHCFGVAMDLDGILPANRNEDKHQNHTALDFRPWCLCYIYIIYMCVFVKI